MDTFLSHLSDLVVTFITGIPWLAIAGAAGFIYWKRSKSMLLLVQAAGAAGMFLLPLLQWGIYLIMRMIGMSGSLYQAEITIYRFLLFVMLCAFAVSYCVERLKKRTEVSGFPVQP